MSAPVIVVLGAAGQMTSVTARAVAMAAQDHRMVLADINFDALSEKFGDLDPNRILLKRLDLNAPGQLQDIVQGARLLIHGAGPFHRTAARVRAACIGAGTDYFDIDDDVESTLEAIVLDGAARAAGVGLYVGHGASPGFTNMLARDLIDRLDEVETVEVAWTVGDEGKNELGRAVAEHTMHIGAGPCLTWRQGRQVTHESFATSQTFPMGQSLGDYRLYEVAHPEPITLPWSFPQLREASCWGGLHPQAFNGLLRGLATAQASSKLTMDEACSFIQAVMNDEFGHLKGWGAALEGMIAQVRRKDNDWRNLCRTLFNALRSVHEPRRSGVAARVTGRKDGRRLVLVRQCADRQSGGFLDTMATITGLSAAAFVVMILQGQKHLGFLPPERWADPGRFYALCADLAGHAERAVVGPILQEEA
jgi:saccharopine dehydrogenase-like NADP-dependent oxidoreductase